MNVHYDFQGIKSFIAQRMIPTHHTSFVVICSPEDFATFVEQEQYRDWCHPVQTEWQMGRPATGYPVNGETITTNFLLPGENLLSFMIDQDQDKRTYRIVQVAMIGKKDANIEPPMNIVN